MGTLWDRWAGRGATWLRGQVNAIPLDTTEKIRLQHFTIFLITGLPLMLFFAAYNLLKGSLQLGLVSLGVAMSLGVARILLRRARSGLIIYRVNAFLFGGMLLYMVAIGGSHGSKALWMFVFPLIAFFLLGAREGALWNAALYLAAMLLFWVLPGHLPVYAYDREFILRFSLVYWIVTAVGYWFEFLRQHYQRGMESEREQLIQEQARLKNEIASRLSAEQEKENLILELQDALSKVNLLRGLLPICASCKKIRDDRGDWVQVERYVRDRTGAEFSHSMCPDCGDQWYPGLREKS